MDSRLFEIGGAVGGLAQYLFGCMRLRGRGMWLLASS